MPLLLTSAAFVYFLCILFFSHLVALFFFLIFLLFLPAFESFYSSPVASLAAVCVLSGLGAQQWWSNSNNSSMQFLHHEIALIDQRAYNGEPLHAAERHYITHGPGLLIGQMALAYQIYELVMTIAIADIRTMLMVNKIHGEKRRGLRRKVRK